MVKLKDSGTEWLGVIPNNWYLSKISGQYEHRNIKVSDVDYQPLSVTKNGVLLQLDTVAKSNAHDDRKLVRNGDFVINSRSDRRGSCGISNYDGSVSLINTVLCPRKRTCSRYFDWLFHTTQFADEFYKWGHGIVDDLWTTNWQDMKKITIPLPPLEEQNRIADFLDEKCAEIDDISNKIQEQINTLEEYKKSVITEVVTKGLNPNVEMKDSGIEWVGNIPKHWKINKVKYHFTNNKYIVGIKSADYSRLALTLKGVIHRDKEDNEGLQPNDFSTYQLVKPNELIFKLIDLQNISTSRIGLSFYQGIVSPAYIILHVKNDINPSFAEKFFRMMWYREIFNALGDAGVRSSLNANDLLNISIPVPPLEEQNRIADFLDEKCAEIDDISNKIQEQISTLVEYKKSLIYEYVTGKKEVA